MLWLRSCPRCQTGDLYLDGDDSKHCLQCGYIDYQTGGSSALVDLEQALQTVLRREATAAGRTGMLAVSASTA